MKAEIYLVNLFGIFGSACSDGFLDGFLAGKRKKDADRGSYRDFGKARQPI